MENICKGFLGYILDPEKFSLFKRDNYFSKILNAVILELYLHYSDIEMKDPLLFRSDISKKDISTQLKFLAEKLFRKNLKRRKYTGDVLYQIKKLMEKNEEATEEEIKRLFLSNLDFRTYFDYDKIFSSFNYDLKLFNCKEVSLFMFFALIFEKVVDSKFMDELEKNYGVFVDDTKFIEEINSIYKSPKRWIFGSDSSIDNIQRIYKKFEQIFKFLFIIYVNKNKDKNYIMARYSRDLIYRFHINVIANEDKKEKKENKKTIIKKKKERITKVKSKPCKIYNKKIYKQSFKRNYR